MINKDYKKLSTPAPKESPKPSYLASLFKPPQDIRDAEIEQAKLFDRIPMHDNNYGSLKG
ncbi:MAG: hypothetical protein K0S76_166 [Herbinix sp.]|jgi:hypothetical protein|nr:hypothetical protein [Herbinix sp.]